MTLKAQKGHWILYRWPGERGFVDMFVQNIMDSPSGNILELASTAHHTSHPSRILEKDIEIVKVFDYKDGGMVDFGLTQEHWDGRFKDLEQEYNHWLRTTETDGK